MSSEYAPGGYGPYGESTVKNGAGIAGLVLGIVGLLLCWIVLGLPLAIIGLIFSIVGFRRLRRGQANNRGVVVTGLVVSIVALLVSLVLTALYAIAFGVFWQSGGMDALNCVVDANGNQAAIQACVDRYDGQ